MISTSVMVMMVISAVFAIVVGTIPMVIMHKKYKTDLMVYIIGCATWFIFAMVLEQIVHTVVLTSPAGNAIQNNIFLYGLYGGLAAGVFEETGRFIVMKRFLKKNHGNPYNSIMFGMGHGGFEAIFLLGTSMLNNFTYALMINKGQAEELIANMPNEAQKEAMSQVITTLQTTPAYMYLVGDFERIAAILMHIALSVLVWIAVVNGKKALYPIAIGMHAVVDMVTAILSKLGLNTIAIEIIVMVFAVAILFFARKQWKANLT